eukprot:TRINITY_DN643_c0_g6_i2.p1 TRINITY_DN643_c0_g6~~TRINITY_DN643_c0_g6_i2.p1  ORF type:complete len:373 (+),score=26.92 TRINITY_DN643_c0_g6_i2:468-1586(+)
MIIKLGLGSILTYFIQKILRKKLQKKRVRVYLDGCFDFVHCGHANALRQAKILGNELVVGLNADQEILKNKGTPPVLTQQERYILLSAIKWVDEIIDGTPYEVNQQLLQNLFQHHNIDFVVHGDDPCFLPDGSDAYQHAKTINKFKNVKRTEGVSTTEILERMLAISRDGKHASQPRMLDSQFMATSRRLVQFSNNLNVPKNKSKRVVYVDGAFDVFHCGHVGILQKAREIGDFVLVGIHPDEDVRNRRGNAFPILGLYERALSVLACKYVDEVIIGAPPFLNKHMIKTFNIGIVLRGMISESGKDDTRPLLRYQIPIQLGIFQKVESPYSMTTQTIIDRIKQNQDAYEIRNDIKLPSAARYASQEYYTDEL